MFPYHNRLKQLLNSEPYIVIDERQNNNPFSFRFIFPQINKSMPIRPHRDLEYSEYMEVRGKWD